MDTLPRCQKCENLIGGGGVTLYDVQGFSPRFCSRSCLFLWLAAQLNVTFTIGVSA